MATNVIASLFTNVNNDGHAIEQLSFHIFHQGAPENS
jgi:hypothetical protein